MDAVTRLLADLVAIPSVNPMGRPLVGPGFREAALSDYLVGYFRDLGVPCRRDPVSPGRDNILARFDPPGARGLVLFDAHQDTVPTDGMTIDPFDPAVRGGRMSGRGSCDIKGGMAAMLAAFARLVRERPAGSASVLMACTVDEEFTHTGSSQLAATTAGVDLAIVAEPTSLDLVDRHKGATRCKVRALGVACHSSTPQQGDNAIYRMAGVVGALAEHAAELARAAPDPVLGPPSLSVGRIEGGQSVNIVPDWCEIEVDRRVIPGEVGRACLRRAEEFVRSRVDRPELVEFLPAWVNMPSLSPAEGGIGRWMDTLAGAIRSVTDRQPATRGVPYGTDAGPLAAAGIPCVVFGPGDIAQAHTKDEWVDLDEVRAASEIYFRMARSIGEAVA